MAEPAANKNQPTLNEDVAAVRAEIEEIKRENLTGQQLRMARKMAVKHGLDASSSLDAVRLLRQKNIDPFTDTSVLAQINPAQVAAGPGATSAPAAAIAKTAVPTNLPAESKGSEVGEAKAQPAIDDSKRMAEIAKIQKDLVKRRRRRIAQLFVKLLMFIGIPTLVAGYYFYSVATPMYSTHSNFLIQQAENPTSSGFGGLLNSTPLATSQDAIAVQDYLTSRDALNRLETEFGFAKLFKGEDVDPLQRLEDDASNEDVYGVYKKRVKIGFDPTEGIVKMEVITPEPEASLTFANALISYAEEQVDQLSLRKREDGMKGAMESYQSQEKLRTQAQKNLLDIQEKYNTFSGEIVVSSLNQQITQLQTQLTERRVILAELLNNARPNAAKVDAQRNVIETLEQEITNLNQELTKGSENQESIAKISGELQLAQAELEMRNLMLGQALQSLETARVEANRQTRYLSMSASPVLPDEASYPKKFENTLLAFLVFAGIYLLLALTASILREQISS